jgi:hypothetical protein
MIIWTRSLEDWAKDQMMFQGYKGKYLHLPCLSSTPISFEAELPKGPFVLAFTSSKASHYFLSSKVGQNFLKHGKSLFSLGKATAEPLLDSGFKVEIAQVKNGEEFQNWILNRSEKNDLFVLPGGIVRAFDLESGLKNAHRGALKLDIYATQALATTSLGTPILKDISEEIDLGSVVCFASPSAVDGFSAAISKRDHIIAFCIGDTTAARALGFKKVITASEPSVWALFHEALNHLPGLP